MGRKITIEDFKPSTRQRHCHTCGTLVGYYTGPQTNAVWHELNECQHSHAYYYCPKCCPSIDAEHAGE